MASPEVLQQIETYLGALPTASPQEVTQLRAEIIRMADAAEAGDAAAAERLLRVTGLVVRPLAQPAVSERLALPEAPVGEQAPFTPLGPLRAPEPTGALPPVVEGTNVRYERLPNSNTYEMLRPREDILGEPIPGEWEATGTLRTAEQLGLTGAEEGGFAGNDLRNLEIARERAQQEADQLMVQGRLRESSAAAARVQEIEQRMDALLLGGQAGGLTPTGGLRNLEFLRQQGLITDEQFREMALAELAGGGGGLTEFQSGQLDISRQRLGLERERVGLTRDEAAIAAARGGNPLALLGLTTGATPQEALRLIPPAPSQVTIQRGGPLAPPSLSGQLRLPGAQAQSRETPTETAARRERTAVQFGLPDVEQEFFEGRIRRSMGPRLRGATAGGTIR